MKIKKAGTAKLKLVKPAARLTNEEVDATVLNAIADGYDTRELVEAYTGLEDQLINQSLERHRNARKILWRLHKNENQKGGTIFVNQKQFIEFIRTAISHGLAKGADEAIQFLKEYLSL